MKQLLIFILWISPQLIFGQIENVGIGTNSPDASARLHVSSSNQGFLMPRLSTNERIAIVQPAEGLMVYDTNTVSFWYFNGGNWQELITPPPPVPSSILFSSLNQVGIAVTNETVVGSFALPANSLATNGEIIEIHSFGQISADTCILRFKFGSNVISFPIGETGNWSAQVRIYRKSATEIKMSGTLSVNNLTVADIFNGFQDLTVIAPIQITAAQSTAIANGLSLEGFSIEKVK
jgi:hypothetical protein